MTSTIKVDTISEKTSANGVAIDSVILKDGAVDVQGVSDGIILDADGDTTISADTDDQIDFKAGGTDVMSMTATGLTINDGTTITTADTSTTLTLKSTDASASAAPRMVFERDSASPADSDQLGLTMYFADNDAGESTNFFEIKALAIDVSDGTEDGQLRFSGMNGGSSVEYMRFDPGSNGTVFNDGSASIDFRVESNNLTHALFVDASTDNVTIGHDTAQARLDVSQSATGTPAFEAHATSSSYTTEVVKFACQRNTTNGTYKFLACNVPGVNDRLQIADSGNVTNINNSYGSLSDERLKSNIVDANSQWDDIKALKVRNFKKADSGDMIHLGVVAQELETAGMSGLIQTQDPSKYDIAHNSVFGTLYEDGDTIPEESKIGDVKEVKEQVKTVKYSVLYMKAIKALQEAQTRIETLETKVKALEDA